MFSFVQAYNYQCDFYLQPTLCFRTIKQILNFSSFKYLCVRLFLRANHVCLYQLCLMFCSIWYHLYNVKNVKSTHRGVLLLVKVTLLRGCFSRFLNCTNGTKSRNASHMRNVITTFLLDICAIIFMDFYEDVFRG